MSIPDRAAGARHDPAADRLDDLDRRLTAAFHRLSGRGDAAAEREGESLRTRRARLRAQTQGGSSGTSVLGEIEALSNAVDNWMSRLDEDERRAEAKGAQPR